MRERETIAEGKNDDIEIREEEKAAVVNPQTLKAYFEYSQPIETGHAADALRDSADELVGAELSEAVGRRRQPSS